MIVLLLVFYSFEENRFWMFLYLIRTMAALMHHSSEYRIQPVVVV